MAAVAPGWGPVFASLSRGELPQPQPRLAQDEVALLVGPIAVFWLCVWAWQAVVLAFPKHAAMHVLTGPKISSPSLLKARVELLARAIPPLGHSPSAASKQPALLTGSLALTGRWSATQWPTR